MKFIMYFIVIAGVAVAALTAVKAFRFSRELRARATRLAEMRPGAPRSDLPAPIQAFAERGLAGAAPGRAIRLKQAAEMRLRMGGAWREIPARQTIAVARSGFAWVASMRVGPVPSGAGARQFRRRGGPARGARFRGVPPVIAIGAGSRAGRGVALPRRATLGARCDSREPGDHLGRNAGGHHGDARYARRPRHSAVHARRGRRHCRRLCRRPARDAG